MKGQTSGNAGNLRGEWVLEQAIGPQPPAGFSTVFEPQANKIRVRTNWEVPRDGRIGLTFVGLVAPDLTLDPTGREVASQVGPLIVRHKTQWEGTRLITRWSTTEFMGSSFRGTWTRSVSSDGLKLTLDIDTASTGNSSTKAQLIFRRK